MLNLASSIAQTHRLIAIVALALLRRIASPDFLPLWMFLGRLLSPFSAKPDRGSEMSNRVIDQLEQRRLLAAEVFDVNPSPGSSSPSDTIDFNGVAVFDADDGVHGRELWRSDGTEAGTWMIKDIYPGFSDSLTNPIAVMDGVLYFTAHDGGPSLGLWKTDGTEAGTILVTRSVQSTYSAVVAGHQLYMAVRQSSTGIELWASDGTALGTRLVKDIYPGTTNSSIRELTAAGDSVYFAADDGVHGSELWKSDGTETGTVLVQDIYPGSSASNPKYLSYYKGNLYFTFQSSSIPNQAYKIWRTDGTTTGTVLFFGTGDSSFYQLKQSGDLLYFLGSGLYRTDGTTAGTIQISNYAGSSLTDVNGTLFSADYQTLFASHGTAATTAAVISIQSPENLTNVAGTLFFTAKATANSTELWKSDGTTAGTSLVKVLDGGSVRGGFEQHAAAGGKLFFRARDQSKGTELFCSDGTTPGTGVVKDIRTGTEDSNPIPATVIDNDLIFTTDTPRQLWKLDASNPAKVFDFTGLVWPFSIWPSAAVSVNDTAVFRVTQGTPRTDELWRSDGTTTGTFALHSFSSGVFELTPFNGKLFFIGRTTSSHHELWTTDGTLAGTTRFLDVVPSASAVYLTGLCVSGNQLFFVVWDSNRGYDLWVTDGTVEGTRCLELPPTTISSNVGGPVAVGNDVFFSSNDGVNGTELWKSDGTPAGTMLVKDINPTGSSNPTSLVNANGTLFFLADDGVNGQELWKSDGTPAGTVRVSDVVPGAGSGTPKFLVASGSIALFTADNGVNGRELWRSDGTAAGTYMLRDILPGSESSGIAALTSTGGYAYFGANDGVHGLEVWRSDGTVAGTMLIADIFAGPADSAPYDFLVTGDSVYFAANDLEHGRELWRLSADFVPPAVQSAFEVDANPMQVSLSFSEALASPFSAADFQMMNVTTGLPIEASMLLVSNNGLSSTIRYNTTSGELPDGEYRLTIPEGSLHDTNGNAMAADHVLNFFILSADANRDRFVDTQDFNLLAANFGGSSKLFSQGNFSYDASGAVDSVDFNLFIGNYGTRVAPAAPMMAAGRLFASSAVSSPDELEI